MSSEKKKISKSTKPETSKELFWADQIAKQIITRTKFHYTSDSIKQPSEYVVKTSASLSGVLHIGRLSDTIRGDSVVTALRDQGVKTSFIWVAENMDPLRKVPKGVPKEYEDYIGMPVTDIPDPQGSYKNYAERHTQEYFEVVNEFVHNDMKTFSMREEYKKGTFTPFITKLLEHADEVRKIQNKYRSHKLEKGWCPWYPICEKCGKIVTTEVTSVENGIVNYVCLDYDFETLTAKGCGHKGSSDPTKGNGKLAWKSEWASQWAAWNVCCEGAGKEYQVPNSAWWINGEITETILKHPMPAPIFYEHLMIDGVKMSASLGNVVYPRDWLSVANPELLRLVYNKRLMMTRTFAWRDLPGLYQEYDKMQEIATGNRKTDNERERQQCQRLFAMSTLGNGEHPLGVSFSHAAIIAQLFEQEEDAISSLQKTGHYHKKDHDLIVERLQKAKHWLSHYAPEDSRFEVSSKTPENVSLSDKQRKALRELGEWMRTQQELTEQNVMQACKEVISNTGLQPKEFFTAAYNVLLNKDRGPKLANFLVVLGKERVNDLFSTL